MLVCAIVAHESNLAAAAGGRGTSGHNHAVDGDGLAIITEAVDCGGTERVMQALADRFPAAAIFSNHFPDLVRDDHGVPAFASRTRLLLSGRRKRHFLGPLYARRLAAAPIGRARVVLTLVSAGWGLAAPSPPGGRLVCYSTGPPPALYGETRLYLRRERRPLRPVLLAAVPVLRRYYARLMRRADRLITVSTASASAIERVYGREAEIVHPPVRTNFFTPAAGTRRHFLTVSRLVPQKRLEPLIDAFRGLDETLVVAGCGPWLDPLRARAPRNVRFTGWVEDAELRELYRSSRGFVCPSVEDFGIVMAEAHACGIPVIAPRAGGAIDIVRSPQTGILVDNVDAPSLAAAVRGVADRPLDPASCRASAERFSEERFVTRMEQVVAEELATQASANRVPVDMRTLSSA